MIATTAAILLVAFASRKGAPCVWSRWLLPLAAILDALVIVAGVLLLLLPAIAYNHNPNAK